MTHDSSPWAEESQVLKKKTSFSGEFTSFRSQPLSHVLLTPGAQKCLVLSHIFGWAKVAYVCNAVAVIFDFITKEDKRVQKFQPLV